LFHFVQNALLISFFALLCIIAYSISHHFLWSDSKYKAGS